uniref:Uncharacterized protein n=1 Tax=Rhizophora mucronata TaxID=61149 RepID=A0A2P2KC39_RHIMU
MKIGGKSRVTDLLKQSWLNTKTKLKGSARKISISHLLKQPSYFVVLDIVSFLDVDLSLFLSLVLSCLCHILLNCCTIICFHSQGLHF